MMEVAFALLAPVVATAEPPCGLDLVGTWQRPKADEFRRKASALMKAIREPNREAQMQVTETLTGGSRIGHRWSPSKATSATIPTPIRKIVQYRTGCSSLRIPSRSSVALPVHSITTRAATPKIVAIRAGSIVSSLFSDRRHGPIADGNQHHRLLHSRSPARRVSRLGDRSNQFAS